MFRAIKRIVDEDEETIYNTFKLLLEEKEEYEKNE